MNRAPEGSTDGDVTRMSLGDRAALALEAYRLGLTEPLADVVRELTPLLWNVVRSQGVDRDTAEDVVQGVWLAFVRSAETIRDPHAVLKWLVVSARRAAWQASGKDRDDARRKVTLGGDDEPAQQLPDADPQPDEAVVVAERDRLLWDAFRGLPERCRQILRFVAFADRPDYKAIADVTGMGVTSVGVTRGRCLAKLRHALDADERWGWS